MSAPEAVPAWRCKFSGCEQPIAFDSKERCYWHYKLDVLPVLNGYDSRANTGHAGKNRNRYLWDSWLDGQPHTLVAGIDYATNTPNMVRATRSAAKRAGVAVTLIPSADSLTVQAQPKQEAGAA